MNLIINLTSSIEDRFINIESAIQDLVESIKEDKTKAKKEFKLIKFQKIDIMAGIRDELKKITNKR